MAAINLNTLDGVYAMNKAPRVVGEGAIEATDSLVVDYKKYPIGTEYFDKTARVKYIRHAVSNPPVIGDWGSQAATTVLT